MYRFLIHWIKAVKSIYDYLWLSVSIWISFDILLSIIISNKRKAGRTYPRVTHSLKSVTIGGLNNWAADAVREMCSQEKQQQVKTIKSCTWKIIFPSCLYSSSLPPVLCEQWYTLPIVKSVRYIQTKGKQLWNAAVNVMY